MSSLFGLNKPNTNLRKNVFDLSEKTLFSLSAGMLLPCLTREVNPGEKLQLHVSALTRTMPLNTAAFVRCRQYYHWFFVPYKQLWTYWDNFINGVDYRTSSLMKSKKTLVVPSIGMLKAVGALAGAGIWRSAPASSTGVDPTKDEHGFAYYRGSSRLFDMLGYGMRFSHDKVRKKVDPPVFDKEVPQWRPSRTNPTGATGPTGATNPSRSSYTSSGRTDVPADSIPDLLKSSQGWFEYVFDEFNTLTEFVDSFGSADDFYNAVKTMHTGQGASQDRHINLFRFLAYQKIYHDFYRRDDYESSNPACFNIDDFVDEGSMSSGMTAERLKEIFRLRYRWQPKDYFTGVVPSELFGSSNIFTQTGFDQFGTLSVPSKGDLDTNNGVKIDSSVTTKSIRAAFAIEKLMRLTRRAGGFDYISQTAAHYGFEPPKGRGDKVDFLGGSSSSINISEVITTADSGDSVVGQVYGKGIGTVGNNEGYIDFTAREHGLVMCITSIVPETEYSAEGLNAFNVKLKRGDYFQPELQDLGLQPVFGYEFQNKGVFKSNSFTKGNVSNVLGFVPRYAEYKTAYDTLHGEFRNGRTMSAWSARSTLNVLDSGVAVNSLKISPKCLDSIFAINYDGREMTDQFMVSAQFLVKAIRPMSVTGQQL